MPPKKLKLHQLAVEVPQGTKFYDPSKKVNYVLGKQFATGGFGRIYTCKEEGQSSELVVKVEPNDNGPLFTEIHVFQRILKKDMIDTYAKQKKLSCVNIPWLISAGSFLYEKEKLRYMVMPKYETSLEAVREKNGGTLGALETWTVASAMINALEYLHHNKYVHADIKAANILLEKKTDMKTATLVDFGLARMVASNVEKPDPKRAHNGTAIFTSTDAHRGCNPSYRGDIEILGYNIIFLINGTLPWQSLENKPDAVYKAKQTFLSNIKMELAKVMPNAPVSSKAIQELFEITLTTAYTNQIDVNLVKKIVEKTMAEVKKTENKPLSSRSSSARPRARIAKPPPTEENEEILPKTSVSRSKARTRAAPKVKKLKQENSLEGEAKDIPIVVRRVKKRPSTDLEEEKESLKENENNIKKIKPKATTSPSIKKDADKLRQNVPGLRNLPKGRRSIIVTRITKKYQKLANKKDLSDS